MDMYDKKLQEISDKELLYNIEMEEHLKADADYKTTIGIVFSLARRASEIFESFEPYEKRQLLSYLIQNPTVKQKTLMFTMRNPFNLILQLDNRTIRGAQWELVTTIFVTSFKNVATPPQNAKRIFPAFNSIH